ncbi:MAG: hypothetical protein IPK50_09930 [Fibrobacterota bacterium]|nr:hypothetical protein [Fibrobacterota bacterium]QQS07196.1 MAG: hypothetical protein IPK50_09930 [Fibrobacterota bacterium]
MAVEAKRMAAPSPLPGTLITRFEDNFERPAEFLGRTEGSFEGDDLLGAKWQILRGSVDVVQRTERYTFLVHDPSVISTPDPQGFVLDLEGSVEDHPTPAKLQTAHGFAAGTYHLTYKLAGTNRIWKGVPAASADYSARIRFGNYANEVTLSYRHPFKTYTAIVTVPSGTRLVVDAICPKPSRAMAGLLLDDVRVRKIR